MLYFRQMWKDSGLDIFGIMSYAAQWSAYNNIEHLWSPMSKKLANAVLPQILEEEQTPPCQQRDLSKKEMAEKEARLFDQVMSLIKDKYWHETEFNGCEITTLVRQSLEKEAPYNDYAYIHKVTMMYLILVCCIKLIHDLLFISNEKKPYCFFLHSVCRLCIIHDSIQCQVSHILGTFQHFWR